MVLVVRYMSGKCHLGPFSIGREDDFEDCPLCEEHYCMEHFILDCIAVHDARTRWLDVGGL